jgi:hypothetical protein
MEILRVKEAVVLEMITKIPRRICHFEIPKSFSLGGFS